MIGVWRIVEMDDGDPASGRGWAIERPDGSLTGRIFFQMGDDSEFLAHPVEPS